MFALRTQDSTSLTAARSGDSAITIGVLSLIKLSTDCPFRIEKNHFSCNKAETALISKMNSDCPPVINKTKVLINQRGSLELIKGENTFQHFSMKSYFRWQTRWKGYSTGVWVGDGGF